MRKFKKLEDQDLDQVTGGISTNGIFDQIGQAANFDKSAGANFLAGNQGNGSGENGSDQTQGIQVAGAYDIQSHGTL